jgi:hypothetical protein
LSISSAAWAIVRSMASREIVAIMAIHSCRLDSCIICFTLWLMPSSVIISATVSRRSGSGPLSREEPGCA